MTHNSSNKRAGPLSSTSTRELTWEIAELFPAQGDWSIDEYLDIPSNRLIELSNGTVEVLASQTMTHQSIVIFLLDALCATIKPAKLGVTLIAPFPVRLSEQTLRQPDVMFMRAEHASRMSEEFWDGADLVMEVVSDDDRRRDLVTKRVEYAEAGIPEYWIIDRTNSTISVLRLDGRHYAVHGEFAAGQLATSVLLGGLAVDVTTAFAAGEER